MDHRIEPGPGDELSELARDFNSMAGRLESYIGWLENLVVGREVRAYAGAVPGAGTGV